MLSVKFNFYITITSDDSLYSILQTKIAMVLLCIKLTHVHIHTHIYDLCHIFNYWVSVHNAVIKKNLY